jgi:hypothetical protein
MNTSHSLICIEDAAMLVVFICEAKAYLCNSFKGLFLIQTLEEPPSPHLFTCKYLQLCRKECSSLRE